MKMLERLSPRAQGCVAIGASCAGAYAVVSALAKRRGVGAGAWVRVQWSILALGLRSEREAQRAAPLPVGPRLSRFGELAFLLFIERNRRFEVVEAELKFPGDPDAIYRLHPLEHVGTQRQLAAASAAEETARMMDARMKADASPDVTDLVLVGGGHSHVHVLRMLGMCPLEGVRVTLIAKDVETPYSGMLPGHVAGAYDRAECHIDLNKLARFARARLVAGEVVAVDAATKELVLADGSRPRIPYDVLSINVGIAPTGVGGSSDAFLTPVKPIAAFSRRWDGVLADLRTRADRGAPYALVVVGGGAGGVELVLAAAARVRAELEAAGEDPAVARFALVARGRRVCGSHAPEVSRLMARALDQAGVDVRLGLAATGAKADEGGGGKVLECEDAATGAVENVRFDACFWCTEAAAPAWLGKSGLAVDGRGFLRIDDLQRVGLEGSDVDGSRATTRVYAGGDCASVDGHPRPKAGVFAVMAGMALYTNLVADATGSPTLRHLPQKSFLGLLGTGDGRAVASRGLLAIEGKWLWDLKDWIDRKWMWQYTGGLPSLDGGGDAPVFAAAARAGKEALDLVRAAPMRCGGCGAKVGASSLTRTLGKLPPTFATPPCDVLIGVDAPDDGAVVGYPKGSPSQTKIVHTVDFFRSFVSDPFVFGQIAANHALSDCDAMGAAPASALALVVLPFGANRCVEDTLLQLMSGARKALDAAGCALVGGHTCEGAELALGFAINGVAPDALLSKKGVRPGDALILTKALGTGAVFAGDMRALAPADAVAGALASMTASNKRAADILTARGCTACTDVTGFGFLGHLAEMCRAAGGASVEVELGKVPLLAGALPLAEAGVFSSLQGENLRAKRAVANHAAAAERGGAAYALLYDPQTAGGLLASVPAAEAKAAVAALREAGYASAAAVGSVAAVAEAHFPASITVLP